MNARTLVVRAIDADKLDFTPLPGEALTSADVERVFRATDVADRALGAAIDAAWNLMEHVATEARPALIAAHMNASALAYAAECEAAAMDRRTAVMQRRNGCTRPQ